MLLRLSRPPMRKVLLAAASCATAVALIVGTTSGAVPRRARLSGTTRTSQRVRPPDRIVVGEGMAGVRLGESKQSVAAVLGKPNAIVPPYWDYNRGLEGRVAVEHNRVTDIWTRSPTQRTANGVGPGVSMPSLRRAYRAIRCHTGRHSPGAMCVLRARRHGTVVETDFMVERGHVRQVEIFSITLPTQGTPIVVHK
jgi:hypothetical protein